MTLAICYGRAQYGVEAPLVTIETDVSYGLPGLAIVGLPQAAVKESKDRVRSAMMNCGFEFPARKIVINLAPADLPKSGGRFDLAIAVSLMAASSQIPLDSISSYECVAELALDGSLRGVPGVLPAAIAAKRSGRHLIVAKENANEAALIHDLKIIACDSLKDVVLYMLGELEIKSYRLESKEERRNYPDMKDVQGQAQARRVLEIAAAGYHSLLLSGPPGTGKTMLASRLPGLMPDMQESEAQEAAALYSVSHLQFDLTHWKKRAFRSPHHTASSVALVGGGSPPRPGEISLAHHGILFLDELAEFQRSVLESLREPLESGRIMISRAAKQAEFPAKFQLIAAMNPCPCGYYGDSQIHCRCSPEQIQRYRAKISGPFLDRIDLKIEVPRVSLKQISGDVVNESSSDVKRRVCAAHLLQRKRSSCLNAHLSVDQIKSVCSLAKNDKEFLVAALEKLNISGRAYYRLLRVARTIADLEVSQNIQKQHLLEAMQFAHKA